jgi:hypothetical protein
MAVGPAAARRPDDVMMGKWSEEFRIQAAGDDLHTVSRA